jgi:GxxExxY protein
MATVGRIGNIQRARSTLTGVPARQPFCLPGGMPNLEAEPLTYAILGACFEVYKELGAGFLEDVYQECLSREFAVRDIPAQSFPILQVFYKGEPIARSFRPDFVCFGQVLVELKALRALESTHRAQVLNYLKAAGLRVGLLVNFGHVPGLEFERLSRPAANRSLIP